MFGRTARGLIKSLQELWTKEVYNADVCTSYQYIEDLVTTLESTCQIAKEKLKTSMKKYCVNYNKGARKMKVGDKA